MLKIAKGIEITDLCSPIIGKLQHAHCSSIVAFDNGELLAVYFHAITEAHRLQAIYGARKKPDEDSWSIPFLVSKDRKIFRMEGNPVLWIAPDTKKLFLFYITSWGGWSTCILRYKTSDDEGLTWSKSTKIYNHISRISKNPPIMLSNGNYLLPATIEFQECTPLFYLSKDQGKTWTDVGDRITLPERHWPPKKAETSKFPERELDQPTAVERNDGSIFCLMRAYRPLGKMYQTIGTEGGIKWSDAEPGILPNPDGGFNMIRLKSGNIAIIYNHSSTERNTLSIALSKDDGKTWKYRRNIVEYHKEIDKDESAIENHPQNFQYPTLYQGPDGMIHCTWSHGYAKNINGKKETITDIQYCSVSEDWIMEQEYKDEEWLL